MSSQGSQPLEGTVLLIRHGIAADPRSGQPDAERPLTEEGWRKTRAAMRGLLRSGWSPDAAFASPHRRAAETLSCLQEAVLKSGAQGCPTGTWEGLVPEGDPKRAEAWLRDRMRGAKAGRTLALVSHQPFLGELIFRLTGHNLEIKKASCTVLEWNGDDWSLRQHFTPADLRDLA